MDDEQWTMLQHWLQQWLEQLLRHKLINATPLPPSPPPLATSQALKARLAKAKKAASEGDSSAVKSEVRMGDNESAMIAVGANRYKNTTFLWLATLASVRIGDN